MTSAPASVVAVMKSMLLRRISIFEKLKVLDDKFHDLPEADQAEYVLNSDVEFKDLEDMWVLWTEEYLKTTM